MLIADKLLDAEQLVNDGTWSDKYGDSECMLRSFLEGGALVDFDSDDLYDKVDQLLSMVFAAYDTTSSSLNNLIYAAWQHPEEAQKVRDAILAHPQLSDPNTTFSIDMLKECNELECFIHEAQRSYGIIPGIIRLVNHVDGLDFGGVTIPDGTGLLIPVEWLHHGLGSWTESMEFKPSRFDKSNGQKKEDRGDIGRYNSIPFFTGIHKCLGIHLAMMELRLYMALMLRDYQFEVDESKMNDDGAINGKSFVGLVHWNVYLKMKKRHRSRSVLVEEEH